MEQEVDELVTRMEIAEVLKKMRSQVSEMARAHESTILEAIDSLEETIKDRLKDEEEEDEDNLYIWMKEVARDNFICSSKNFDDRRDLSGAGGLFAMEQVYYWMEDFVKKYK